MADAPLCTQVQTHEQLGLSGSDSLQNGKCGLPLELPAISAAHLYASSWHAFCVPINAGKCRGSGQHEHQKDHTYTNYMILELDCI